MAITKSARARIFTLVQEIKKLLVIEVASQLEQYYGIRLDGSILIIDQLPSTEPEILHTARLLRQRIDYIKSNIPTEKNKEVEAVKQLLNEQAFSILNRFATLRMAEERGIIKETIRKEYNSEGFQIFDSITGQGKVAEQYIRYKWYLLSIFDELAIDLPSVFDRFSPYALIFPSEKAMRSLLTIINNENVTMHREEGIQPMNLWREDETIGWIYQYYNSRDEISEMRDASSAPRNSRELAVRNQFFTPRYVVQFLTDNSLGRIWYEMTKGNTGLTETCQYLIRRPKELFLDKGNSRPENADEETDYIEHRAIKDPREILMLDPACGSMHFGLYSFDLFEQIYLEAWDNHPDLLLDIRNSITRQQYIKQIPEYIIRHNIHGVDIDPRALQIAALSLWLRAQKSFDKLNLEADDRPQITKSNLVLAEAMPGNAELLSELIKPLDAPMRKLVTSIWDLMKMAGETGLLLIIEEEIDKKINEIAEELSEEAKGSQLKLDSGEAQLLAAERAAFYATKKYRDTFLENASTEVFKILKLLAETANEGEAYQKLLFADDAARGFAFIELCKKKYDVILMNPPFGAASVGSKEYIDKNYPTSRYDLASVFVERMLGLLTYNCFLGCISTRSIFFLGSYTEWRAKYLIEQNFIKYFADFGGGVLDAMVETSSYIIQKGSFINKSRFYRLTKQEQKEILLSKLILQNNDRDIYNINTADFKSISNEPFCYWIDNKTLRLFIESQKFENLNRGARLALKTADNDRYVRNHWEVANNSIALHKDESYDNKPWSFFLMCDSSIRFFNSIETVVFFKNNGYELRHNFNEKGQLRSRPMDTYNVFYRNGLSWSFRTSKFQPHIISNGSIATSVRCIAVFENDDQILYTNSLWNSEYMDYCLKLSMQKDLQPAFINGSVNQLPYPDLPKELQSLLKKITLDQFNRVKEIFRIDDRSLAFTSNEFLNHDSLLDFYSYYSNTLKSLKSTYLSQMSDLNNLVYSHFNISNQEREDICEIVSALSENDEGRIFELTTDDIVNRISTLLIGCVFQKWDIRILKEWNLEWSDEDVFKARQNSPFLFGQKETTLDLILPEFYKKIEQIWEEPYPIESLKENASTKDLVKKLKEVIIYFWPNSASTIEFELQDYFGVSDLEMIFNNPNKFFDTHLKDYSKNKRISPIYWPISTSSGSYTIWLYYPKLTDQTLVAVINNYLQPKIDEVIKLKKTLELNSILDNKGLKELKELNDFEHELEDMKKELLRITALPFKPNLDDGVLITAAPLHNIFRHTKWRKATEDCWKELEKGEYDWAHLAYSIWPDRVTKKCKKDLSMAIAHRIENICEVKPKEKKEKTVKEKEIKNKMNVLNFDN